MAAAPAQPSPTSALPHLVTVTGKQHVQQAPWYLFMSTNNLSGSKQECLFSDEQGRVVYRLKSSGLLLEKKTLCDAAGNVVCICKKNPVSLAKWSIKDSAGNTLAKTSTIAGMVKYGLEVRVPSCSSAKGPLFMVTPDPSLSKVLMWQRNGKGVEDTPMAEAQYGSNVVMGLVNAAIREWSYHVRLDPGADVALVCCLLTIYTGLVEWNAMGGMFGMT